MKHVQHSAPPTGSDRARSPIPRRCSAVKLACAGALSVTALIAVGCGSSSTAPSTSGDNVASTAAKTVATTARPARKAAHPPTVHKVIRPRHSNEHSRPPKITKGNSIQRPVAGTGGATANDDNPAGKASRADTGGRPTTRGEPNPCVLVSGAQAQAFTGKAVTVKEAPLGPTCIYQESGAKTPVTIAVGRMRFSAIKPHLKKLSQLTIGGRTAYCGVYGAAITYVPLSGNRVLNVAAPCAIGTRFAAAALPKLGE